jgi:hypothetical protein
LINHNMSDISKHFETPPEYQAGVPAKNAIAPGGFQDHFVVKRFSPVNGTDFKTGGRINFKVYDHACLLHCNQVYLKWLPTAIKDDGTAYTGGSARAAISGKTSAIKSVSASCYGELLEAIPNYNRYWAQEIISAPLEQKVYLAATEGTSYFIDGEMTGENNKTNYFDDNGKQYYFHQLQISALSSLGTLELPLITSGINVDLVLETDLTNMYPVPDTIKDERWSNVELVCVMTRPRENFWEQRTRELQAGHVIRHPMQTIRWQTFQGNNGNQFTMNVDSQVVKSVSSIVVLGNNTTKMANTASRKIDKLSYSDDLNIRTIRFSVGGKVFPELKGISYNKHDPEAYVLGFRHNDLDNLAFVPSMRLYNQEATIADLGGSSSLIARGWQFRFSFKDALSAYGDGLTTFGGNFGITVSTIPDAPDFLATVDPSTSTFSTANSFDVYYVTDQVLEISNTRVRVTPVF